MGQYLVLFNENGFSLFGGSKLELLHKFEDAKVSDLLFSPDEKYIICDDGHRVKIFSYLVFPYMECTRGKSDKINTSFITWIIVI